MLDNNQLKAVNIGVGPALIVAGPGSGKTRVLTHHIKYLIEEQHVLPSRILVITFSRAASAEMKSRFEELLPNIRDVNFGTFHSIYYRFLKLYQTSIPNICDDITKKKILSHLINDTDDFDNISSKISYYKSKLSHADECEINQFKEIIDKYNTELKTLNLMDYDDILINAYEMIRKDENIRNRIKNYFDHILVDEFQDINEYQYLTLKMISNNNIFVVGDDDQSIYGFRGADGGLMLRFLDDFQNCQKIVLNKNYRSMESIVRASENVINENTDRMKTEPCISVNHEEESGFNLIKCKDNDHIVDSLLSDIKSIDTHKSVAVLVRTNKELNRYRKIIYNDKENIIQSYKSIIFKTYIYYLDYIITGNKESFLKIINIPNRFISRNLVKDIDEIEDLNKILLGKYCYQEASVFVRHINTLKKCVPFSFALFLENVTGIKKYYEDNEDLTRKEVENIFNEIREYASSSTTLNDFYKHLIDNAVEVQTVKPKNEHIRIMTFHASKGLEFDVCFIPDVIEGKIPGHGGFGVMDVSEERRLFYVAMTRAKERLYIYTIKNEENASTLPSRFLKNLLE